MIKSNFLKKVNEWKRIVYLCVVLLSFCSTMAFAQGTTITGTVTDESGEALIGVSVFVRGTPSIGASTNINGAYSLSQVPPQSTLVFTYLGYVAQEIAVNNRTSINVRLSEDTQMLDEVVVIGYGVQRRALVTGATANIQGEELQRMSTNNPLTALQNMLPGVSIMSGAGGQPGQGLIVNIRGIGTSGESRPLYVVDGVASGHDALNTMNPADIESIDILRDAASAAIYGSRGANGVVLITTKQGKAGRARITYEGFYGQQYMIKSPSVLTSKEYMQVQNEMAFNSGGTQLDWATLLPNFYDDIMSGKRQDTDWVRESYQEGAPTVNHAFNVTGGNDGSRYALGYSYSDQKYIMGAPTNPFMTRHTFRLNSEHTLYRKGTMEVLKIGQTLNYNYRLHNNILGQGRNDGGLRDLMVAMPFMPVYNENGDWYRTADMTADKWGWMPSQVHNPIARQVHTNRGLRLNKTHGLNASVNVQLQPIQNLFFRSQYSYSFNATSNRNATIAGSFGSHSEGFDRVDMEQNINFNWQVSNTATYIFKVQEHDFTAMIGQEAYKTGYGERVRAAGRRLQFDLNEMGFDYAWLSNLQTAASVDDRSNVEGAPASEYSIASFFGRLQWNLGGTYMADLIFRADGSSRFARGNRWGYFPAVSAGWVLTNEEFMESQNIFNHLRLRASWGLNGNQQVSAFQYLTTYTYGTGNNIPVPNYFFGENKRAPVVGIRPDRLRNPDITWERQNQVNIGIDMRYLNNRLGLNIDLYNRLTENWLLDAPISATWGYAAPNVNGGSVRNQGAEFALSWNERRGDFRYGINVNGSYNKNKVVSIANPEGIIYGTTNVLAEPTHEIFRLQVGQPMGVFYLYKHDGIFQTQAEVDAHVNSQGVKIQPNAVAGDIRFRDVNDDGVINLDDRVFQGSGWPTTRLNFSINAGYKGFDFMVAANGAFGHKILKSYRSFADRPWENFTTHVFQRWTGYGSTNFYPRLTNGAHINYTNISGLWMEKGDYLKLANITLGYDFKNLVPSMPFSRARIYFTAQNLLVITGYSGMDPEVGRGAGGRDWAAGIDYGFWPSARTFLGGIQLTF